MAENTPVGSSPGATPYRRFVVTEGQRWVHVSGTVGCTPDRSVPSGLVEQTELALRGISHSLQAAGADMVDVVRVVVYALDLEEFEAHARSLVDDAFAAARPAATFLQVPRLANPQYAVEIEVTANGGGTHQPSDDSSDTGDPRPRTTPAHQRLNPFGMAPPSRNAYSQAVVSEGPRHVHLSAIGPRNDEDGAIADDIAGQATVTMGRLERALHDAGLERSHVVRIVIGTTDMDEFRAQAGRVVFGFFEPHKPTSTLLGVTRLSDPAALVEITATAVDDRDLGSQFDKRSNG